MILYFFQKLLIHVILKNALNSDLESSSKWAYQWKLQFNPDLKKQANEVIFSHKSTMYMYPQVTFNNNTITKCPHQKHLGVFLDSKLDFNIHIEQKVKKVNNIIGLIRRFSMSFPRKALLTICKSFDVLYDKPGNQNFENKMEKFQYKACVTITVAIQGNSRQRLYDDFIKYH